MKTYEITDNLYSKTLSVDSDNPLTGDEIDYILEEARKGYVHPENKPTPGQVDENAPPTPTSFTDIAKQLKPATGIPQKVQGAGTFLPAEQEATKVPSGKISGYETIDQALLKSVPYSSLPASQQLKTEYEEPVLEGIPKETALSYRSKNDAKPLSIKWWEGIDKDQRDDLSQYLTEKDKALIKGFKQNKFQALGASAKTLTFGLMGSERRQALAALKHPIMAVIGEAAATLGPMLPEGAGASFLVNLPRIITRAAAYGKAGTAMAHAATASITMATDAMIRHREDLSSGDPERVDNAEKAIREAATLGAVAASPGIAKIPDILNRAVQAGIAGLMSAKDDPEAFSKENIPQTIANMAFMFIAGGKMPEKKMTKPVEENILKPTENKPIEMPQEAAIVPPEQKGVVNEEKGKIEGQTEALLNKESGIPQVEQVSTQMPEPVKTEPQNRMEQLIKTQRERITQQKEERRIQQEARQGKAKKTLENINEELWRKKNAADLRKKIYGETVTQEVEVNGKKKRVSMFIPAQKNGKQQWDLISGKKTRDAQGRLVGLTDKSRSELQKIYDYYETTDGKADALKWLGKSDNPFTDYEDVANVLQKGGRAFERKPSTYQENPEEYAKKMTPKEADEYERYFRQRGEETGIETTQIDDGTILFSKKEIRQTDLFGGPEKTMEELAKEAQARQDREEIKRRLAERPKLSGGVVDPNAPLWRGKGIIEGEQTSLFSKKEAQTKTPEFKKWFGDWENAPNEASKVVDENGKPLIVYHGRPAKYNYRPIVKNSESIKIYDKKARDIWNEYGEATKDIFNIPWEKRFNDKKMNDMVDNAVYVRDEKMRALGKRPEALKITKIKNNDINIFDKSMLGSKTYGNASDKDFAATSLVGFWHNSGRMSRKVGPKNSPYDTDMANYVNIKNPLEYSSMQELADDLGGVIGNRETRDSARRKVFKWVQEKQKERYDGIIVPDTEFGGVSYVPFESSQIKSATENSGAFNPANPDIRYSKGKPEQGIFTKERLNSYYKNAGLGKLFEAVDEMPDKIKGHIESRGFKEGEIEAAYNPESGKIYIRANSIKNKSDILRTARHEITHLGLRITLKDRITPIYESVYRKYKDSEIGQRIKDNYFENGFDDKKQVNRQIFVDEVLAKLGEENIDPGYFRTIVLRVKQLLIKRFPGIKFTDMDVRAMIARGQRAGVKMAERLEMVSEETRFSKREPFSDDEGKKIAQELGVTYKGIQEGVPGRTDDMYVFQDGKDGGSFVGRDLENARERMNMARDRLKEPARTWRMTRRGIDGKLYEPSKEEKELIRKKNEEGRKKIEEENKKRFSGEPLPPEERPANYKKVPKLKWKQAEKRIERIKKVSEINDDAKREKAINDALGMTDERFQELEDGEPFRDYQEEVLYNINRDMAGDMHYSAGVRDRAELGKLVDSAIDYLKKASKDELEGAEQLSLFSKKEKILSRKEGKELLKDREYMEKMYADNLKNEIVGRKKANYNVGLGIDKALGSTLTRLGHISPEIRNRMKEFEFETNNMRSEWEKPAVEWFKSKGKMTRDDRITLDLAEKNRDMIKIEQIVNKYGIQKEYVEKRKMLEDIYQRAKQSDLFLGHLDKYAPNKVQDFEGLVSAVKGTEHWSTILEAVRKFEEQENRPATTDELYAITNSLLMGRSVNGISLKVPGGVKERKIGFITPELNKYYMPADIALQRYIKDFSDAIAMRKFFTGDLKLKSGRIDLQETIGGYVARKLLAGGIKHGDEKILQEILQARFKQGRIASGLGVLRDLLYLDTLGFNPYSPITQFQDNAWALYHAGIFKTIQAVTGHKGFEQGKWIKMEDIGINKIAHEFTNPSKSSSVLATFFKYIGFEKMDRIGKENFINATARKYQAMAKRNPAWLRKKIGPLFENKEGDFGGVRVDGVVDDFARGELTDDVKYTLFADIIDFQPLTASNATELYNKHGNARLLYMLKTYTLQQIDVFRREVADKAKGDPKQAAMNLAKLSGYLIALGMGVDTVRDLLSGRKVDPIPTFWDNVAKLSGLTKYAVVSVTRGQIKDPLYKIILPPLDIVFDPIQEGVKAVQGKIDDVKKIKDLETLKHIPIAGKIYYWWFGGGHEKELKNQKMRPSTTQGKMARLAMHARKTEDVEKFRKWYAGLPGEERGKFIQSAADFNEIRVDAMQKKIESKLERSSKQLKYFERRMKNLERMYKKGMIKKEKFDERVKEIKKEQGKYIEENSKK